MAKKSWIARDKKKADTVKRYAELREQLKAEKDYIGLTMLPRNASPTRMVNRPNSPVRCAAAVSNCGGPWTVRRLKSAWYASTRCAR